MTDARRPKPAPGTYTIDLGAPGDERHIGWGFYGHEEAAGISLRWIGEQPLINGVADYSQADLYVDLPPGDYSLQIEAQAFVDPRQVAVVINGESIDTLTVTPKQPAGLHPEGFRRIS